MKNKTCGYALCPKFEKAFSIIGKKWNGLIIHVLYEEKQLRFGELARRIPMLSDRVLVERLKELEREGIVTKMENLYQLTEKGEHLALSIVPIKDWSHDWVTDDECQ